MEKRNVMKTGVLWREVVADVHAHGYKDVELEHMLADAGGVQRTLAKQFDAVTDNLFGDMLSDIAAMLTGSLGRAAISFARRGAVDAKTKRRKALYEPSAGSAPDIARKALPTQSP